MIFIAIIDICNLTFAYPGSYDNIFEDVSFRIDTSWKLGFVGRNGRGKTTFLKLLMGDYEYSGKILSSVDFEYFPFSIEDANLSALDIIKEKANLYDYEYYKIQKELKKLDLNEDILYCSVNNLSGGEQIKILLISLFLKENAFLLIDEPTNHLDIKAREVVSDYLKSNSGFILVSHDRSFLDNCVDHILSINRTNIEIQKGNFSSWYKNKQLQDDFEIAQNKRLKKDIARLESSAKQTAEWSNRVEKTKFGPQPDKSMIDRGYIGHTAAKMMSRSKNVEARKQAAIEEKSKLLKNIEYASELKINFLKHHSTNLLEFKNASLFYGDKKVCENLNFDVNQGERVALYGKNGCGKSTILKFINEKDDITIQGYFKKVSNLKISYVSQDTSHLKGNLRNFAEQANIDESLFKAILRKLDFLRVQFEKDISGFSGGQKKKVLIAKSLCEQAHLYLWDEPLNFIDVLSRVQIEDLILKFKPTILFVEHDKTFVKNVANKIITLAE